jgi:MFS family permease
MRLSKPVSFLLLASLVVSFLAGSSAPSPLYGLYQRAWGFSPITITIVFGVYAIAVLASLLTVGSLSDYIGRKPVLLVATLAQAVTMLLFTTAHGVGGLILARIVQGLATGAAVGAVGAAMLDIDRVKGTLANAVAPLTGTALGGILGGLIAQYLPGPTHTVYWVMCGVFLIQAAGIALMSDSVETKPGALASLRPHFSLPPSVRQAMLLAVPVLVATWALAGFYASLGPTLVRQLVGSDSLSLGGSVIFVIAGSGALSVWLMHARPAHELMTLGSAALASGVAITLGAFPERSTSVFFIGAAIAGIGFGSGLQGAIRTVVPLAAPHERAGVLSTVYVVAYLAMGLPAVFGGIGVVYGDGLFATARDYGFGVIVLAVFALAGSLLKRPAIAPATPSQVAVAAWRNDSDVVR